MNTETTRKANRIISLIAKEAVGIALTLEEQAELQQWRTENEQNDALHAELIDRQQIERYEEHCKMIESSRPAVDMNRRIAAFRRKKALSVWPRVTVAAALIGIMVTGIALLSRNADDSAAGKQAIMPGKMQATLVLENGDRVELTPETRNIVATETSIETVADGGLHYKLLGKRNRAKDKFNTLEVPRGGEYRLVLDDGTAIWLNSDSRIKYPVAFDTAERVVYLEGEAYFQVAENAEWPFKVVTDCQTITVYGTEFDVAAYADEQTIRTTLLSGSVGVESASGFSVMLSPGSQAVVTRNGQSIETHNINVDDVVGWRNGMLIFDDLSLGEIMRNLSRWYDFEYVFDADVAGVVFKGRVPRYTDFADVLEVLENSGDIRFATDNKRITITKSR